MRPAATLLRRFTLLLLLAPSTALAAWPHDPAVNLPVCTALGDQSNQTAIPDGAGGMIVTWQDGRAGAAPDIYAQRVSAAGVPLWTANGVAICTNPNYQYAPMICSDGAGGAIIAWHDSRNVSSYDIYAQRVNASGTPQWTANGIAVCTAVGDQYITGIVSDAAGGAIVCWSDLRSGDHDSYAQRVNAAGVPQWTATGVAIAVATNTQVITSLIADGAGGAIMAWYDYRTGDANIWAQRVNAAGTLLWGPGITVTSALGNQYNPVAVSDGAGGAVIAWYDSRNPTYDIYAQRVNASGNQWTASGVPVCNAASDQYSPAICSDGAGGAIISWYDYRNGGNSDVYAQRMSSGGVAMWATNGVPLCNAANSQYNPFMVSDGLGGAVVTWYDYRYGGADIYAQRVNASGAVQWTSDGAALSGAVNEQVYPLLVSDGASGAIAIWQDNRGGAFDLYAQRIERFGYLGNPEPVIASVRDVPNDQGGKVKLSWDASYIDTNGDPNLYLYDILRSVPPNAANRAIGAGMKPHTLDEARSLKPGDLVAVPSSVAGYYWEYLNSVTPLHYVSGYSFLAPTTGDSIAAGNPRTAFMVVAHDYGSYRYWMSPPDSGYSVDNLPPSQPAPFQGQYFAGATHLHWDPNSEGDLAGYRLYKGASSGFVPGPGNLVSAQPDTGYADNGAAGSWYKLSAVDAHGNESPFAILGPNGTVAVDDHAPATLAFALASANPAHGATTLRYALPRSGSVRIEIYDVSGRLVRTLFRGERDAGTHDMSWDGTDASGARASDGIYLARLEAEGHRLALRLTLLH